ncbi:MAG: hypothetical protein FWD76_03335 [Firmicutes bacterium]|nr:hypothetical protein [Bacillota bacterium]
MIKRYGNTKTFDDGEGNKIVFKFNGNLLTLYKSFVGNDLLDDFAEFAKLDTNNIKKIEKHTGKSIDAFRKLPQAEQAKILSKAKVSNDKVQDFINGYMLCLYMNSLTTQERDEIMGARDNALEYLPTHFFKRTDIMQSAIDMLTQFVLDIKKN